MVPSEFCICPSFLSLSFFKSHLSFAQGKVGGRLYAAPAKFGGAVTEVDSERAARAANSWAKTGGPWKMETHLLHHTTAT